MLNYYKDILDKHVKIKKSKLLELPISVLDGPFRLASSEASMHDFCSTSSYKFVPPPQTNVSTT